MLGIAALALVVPVAFLLVSCGKTEDEATTESLLGRYTWSKSATPATYEIGGKAAVGQTITISNWNGSVTVTAATETTPAVVKSVKDYIANTSYSDLKSVPGETTYGPGYVPATETAAAYFTVSALPATTIASYSLGLETLITKGYITEVTAKNVLLENRTYTARVGEQAWEGAKKYSEISSTKLRDLIPQTGAAGEEKIAFTKLDDLKDLLLVNPTTAATKYYKGDPTPAAAPTNEVTLSSYFVDVTLTASNVAFFAKITSLGITVTPEVKGKSFTIELKSDNVFVVTIVDGATTTTETGKYAIIDSAIMLGGLKMVMAYTAEDGIINEQYQLAVVGNALISMEGDGDGFEFIKA